MATVKSNQFQMTVSKMLKDEYYSQVVQTVEEVVPKVAKDAAKKLKSESPTKTGKYAKKWTSREEKGRTQVTATVYGNAPTYRLAHLLENGHALRNGKRSRAIVHIAPVEEWAIEEVQKRIAEKVGAI